MTQTIYQVDSFTSTPFQGSPSEVRFFQPDFSTLGRTPGRGVIIVQVVGEWVKLQRQAVTVLRSELL